jgi:hypothetical protein
VKSLCLALAFGSLAALSGPALAEPFHHPYGEWREYNADWLSACPDQINEEDTSGYYGTSCFATTGSQLRNDANLPAYSMSLILNRLTGDLDVIFTVAPTDGTVLDETGTLEVRFSGEPAMVFDFEDDLETRYNTTNQYFIVDEARREALLEAMRERTAAIVAFPVSEGEPEEIWLSMRGVLASLDFMSTYARRVGEYD